MRTSSFSHDAIGLDLGVIALMPDYTVRAQILHFLGRPVLQLDETQAQLLAECSFDSPADILTLKNKYGIWATEFLRMLNRLGIIAVKPDSVRSNSFSDIQRCLIISPHMDDAFLSIGGLMMKLAECTEVHVVDIFGDDPWCTWHKRFWPSSAEIIQIREREEAFSAWLSNCTLTILNFQSAPQRGHRTWNEAPDSVTDESTTARIYHAIKGQIDEKDWDLVLWPLQVGGHTDHQVVHQCALSMLEQDNHFLNRFIFYEDMPYSAIRQHWSTFSLHKTVEKLAELTMGYVDVSTYADEKKQILRVYGSQLTPDEPFNISRYSNPNYMHTGVSIIDSKHKQLQLNSSNTFERIWMLQPNTRYPQLIDCLSKLHR